VPGWDFINRDEVTIGEALAAAGYRTAHFGKWHNLQVGVRVAVCGAATMLHASSALPA
jgi:arylsulfatase A-like enzyme